MTDSLGPEHDDLPPEAEPRSPRFDTPEPPHPVNWNLLTANDLEAELLELNRWVDWLRHTYGLPASVVPPYWHRHPELLWGRPPCTRTLSAYTPSRTAQRLGGTAISQTHAPDFETGSRHAARPTGTAQPPDELARKTRCARRGLTHHGSRRDFVRFARSGRSAPGPKPFAAFDRTPARCEHDAVHARRAAPAERRG